MKLIRYENPSLQAIETLFDQAYPNFNRLNAVWDRLFENSYTSTTPATDLYEDVQNYYVRVELPGVKREAIELNLEKRVLTLSFKKESGDGETKQSHTFTRSLTVPDGVQEDSISAKLENGVLTIQLPKAEQVQARTIQVN